MNGIERIAAERQRQITDEGWTPEHDAKHKEGELALAAVAYAIHGVVSPSAILPRDGEEFFPWDWGWWKPTTGDPLKAEAAGRIRNLEKAGALIAAEIDRLLAKDHPNE